MESLISAFAAFGVAAIVTGGILWALSPVVHRHLDEKTIGGENGESQ